MAQVNLPPGFELVDEPTQPAAASASHMSTLPPGFELVNETNEAAAKTSSAPRQTLLSRLPQLPLTPGILGAAQLPVRAAVNLGARVVANSPTLQHVIPGVGGALLGGHVPSMSGMAGEVLGGLGGFSYGAGKVKQAADMIREATSTAGKVGDYLVNTPVGQEVIQALHHPDVVKTGGETVSALPWGRAAMDTATKVLDSPALGVVGTAIDMARLTPEAIRLLRNYKGGGYPKSPSQQQRHTGSDINLPSQGAQDPRLQQAIQRVLAPADNADQLRRAAILRALQSEGQ